MENSSEQKPEKVKSRVLPHVSERMKKTAAIMATEGVSFREAATRAGYSPSVAKTHASRVMRSPSWAELMSIIDDVPLVERVRSIAMNGKDSDSLEAVKLIQKWKGRDANVVKIAALKDELAAISEPTEAAAIEATIEAEQ